MNDAGGGLDALLHDLATTLGIAQAGGGDLTQRESARSSLSFWLLSFLSLIHFQTGLAGAEV